MFDDEPLIHADRVTDDADQDTSTQKTADNTNLNDITDQNSEDTTPASGNDAESDSSTINDPRAQVPYIKGTVIHLCGPPPKHLEEGNADIDDLPGSVQKKIWGLEAAIAANRPTPPRFARRGPPPRPVYERWRAEEDELMLLLADHGFPYRQIAYVSARFVPRKENACVDPCLPISHCRTSSNGAQSLPL